MNVRLLTSSVICCLVLLLSMGNKNGRASSANRGNTGAPGDETSLGQPKTCLSCHNQGPITASLAITVLDNNNQPVTQYHPGQQYIASVKITGMGTTIQGYGFQMIALRDAGNTDLDGFTDVNPNNYKIATITNGRTYAEHDNISGSNTFNVKWTAPAAGTGSVTFYASGNAINGNGTTSGDGAGFSNLKLTEAASVATDEPTAGLPLKIFPNPMTGDAQLDAGALTPGDYRVSAYNSSAVKVWEEQVWLTGGNTALNIPASGWPAGAYFFQLEGAGARTFVKAIRL